MIVERKSYVHAFFLNGVTKSSTFQIEQRARFASKSTGEMRDITEFRYSPGTYNSENTLKKIMAIAEATKIRAHSRMEVWNGTIIKTIEEIILS